MDEREDIAAEGQEMIEQEQSETGAELNEMNDESNEPTQVEGRAHERFGKLLGADSLKPERMTGMFRDWYLDYASYVILERAVPHLQDGLKPVQRRILHSLKKMDDGRYNKVANVIGYTMQYHPHGDASIGDALVGWGKKIC